MKSSRLIIWDCDGVLVDSEIINNRVEAEVKTAYGFPITIEEQILKFTGLSIHHPLVQAEIKKLPPDYLERVDHEIAAAYPKELRAIRGIRETLGAIALPHCVASSSHPDWLIMKLKITELSGFFADAVFSGHQVKRGKPEPDLFLFAAEKMGVAPGDCLVIEDSVPGVQAGKAAGMQVCGFTGGGHTYPEHERYLLEAGAHFILGDITQLIKML
jgi:HAD superfamily hydrolase (TIGR01509 family)